MGDAGGGSEWGREEVGEGVSEWGTQGGGGE